jgi:hypothetical protein
MRKFFIITAAIVALLAGYHYGTRWYLGTLWASSFCDKIELASVDSPDSRWQAKAVQFGCGDALLGSFDFVAVVVVGKDSWWTTERDEVLRGGSKWECGGKLVWQANQLQIFLPENMIVDRQTKPTANVTFTISKIPVADGISRDTCLPPF